MMKKRSARVSYFGATRSESCLSLEAFASDASIYRIQPTKVISPESEREAVAAVTEAIAAGKIITPRGGGTGLAGAALGRGYVVNCSRLTDIINISMASKTVT
ncbi:MAG: FAD-binding oxidoreductase, partial [FCB group bacterium]|nr:FAD-binding oxidoreductase [FCB group bacterium]